MSEYKSKYSIFFVIAVRAVEQTNNPQRLKATFGHVRPAKLQISLRIRAVRSEASIGAFWIPKDAKFLHITKTRLYSFDKLKHHFYKVKLGFTGV